MPITSREEVDVADTADEVDETPETDDSTATAPKAAEKPAAKPTVDASADPSNRWRWMALALLVVLVAGGVFGFLRYRGVTDQLDGMRQQEADRAAAAQVARDYALKSLTYSFEAPDAFFASVEEGVSPTLKDKYVNATDLLKGIMVQAQVTSSGEILATEVTPQPGQVYQVVVSAAQTTRNLQNPQPRVSIVLLQIIVNRINDTWQVSDIGPKTGSKPVDGPLPPGAPGAQPRLGPLPAPPPVPGPPR